MKINTCQAFNSWSLVPNSRLRKSAARKVSAIAGACLNSILLLPTTVSAEPYDTQLGSKIDTYLSGRGSPIAGNGAAAPQLVEAQSITSAAAAPSAIPANVTTDIKFTATVTGRPLHVEVTHLNGPAGHPIVVGQLRKKECRDHDDDRDGADGDDDRDCRKATANDVYTLSKRFNLPVGQAQFQISAPGAQGQVVSPLIPVLFLSTPPGFTVDGDLLTVGGPLNYTTFNNNYVQGGIIPNGGADIHVATVPLPSPPLNNYIDIQLAGTTITSRAPLIVSGVTCTQIFYTITYIANLVYKNEVVYCPSGKSLYRFDLSYNAGDPSESRFLSGFQQVVSNAQFAP